MFCHNNKAFLFACQKDAAGVALTKADPALGSSQQKNQLQLHPESCGSRRLRLRNTASKC